MALRRQGVRIPPGPPASPGGSAACPGVESRRLCDGGHREPPQPPAHQILRRRAPRVYAGDNASESRGQAAGVHPAPASSKTGAMLLRSGARFATGYQWVRLPPSPPCSTTGHAVETAEPSGHRRVDRLLGQGVNPPRGLPYGPAARRTSGPVLRGRLGVQIPPGPPKYARHGDVYRKQQKVSRSCENESARRRARGCSSTGRATDF